MAKHHHLSDGERTALVAKPTDERPQTPFRYIADVAAVIQASEFEAEVDSFIDQVLQRLDSEEIADTNLQEIWKGVLEERRTPELAKTRKLEALLSLEPDESKWETGRRFELARLLGDRIAGPKGGRLFPATRAYTYRQKMQRSFAAELLSPFDVVDEMLEGDYSAENQLEVAEHFGVSEWTIRTQLVNHGRLEREDLEGELEAAAA